jgi:threonine/homoserine/homoserine lactone efflux protein
MLPSAANPYFLIWWLTVGSAIVLSGHQVFLAMSVLFLIGHWDADVLWYTLVSASLYRGRALLSKVIYGKILALCGCFLMLVGAYYLSKTAGGTKGRKLQSGDRYGCKDKRLR